jgi:hypothetical protein
MEGLTHKLEPKWMCSAWSLTETSPQCLHYTTLEPLYTRASCAQTERPSMHAAILGDSNAPRMTNSIKIAT